MFHPAISSFLSWRPFRAVTTDGLKVEQQCLVIPCSDLLYRTVRRNNGNIHNSTRLCRGYNCLICSQVRLSSRREIYSYHENTLMVAVECRAYVLTASCPITFRKLHNFAITSKSLQSAMWISGQQQSLHGIKSEQHMALTVEWAETAEQAWVVVFWAASQAQPEISAASLPNLTVRVSKCSIPNRKHMGGRNRLIICALSNNHNHLFSSEIKETPVDELAEVRAERGSCEESSAVLRVEGVQKTSWVCRYISWDRNPF